MDISQSVEYVEHCRVMYDLMSIMFLFRNVRIVVICGMASEQ